jgi:3-dehydroquinate synthase
VNAAHDAGTVHVPSRSGTPRGYDIIVRADALADLPLCTAAVAAARFVVIADATVAALYGGRVLDSLRHAGSAAELLTFPAGEAHKTRETWIDLSDRMLAMRCGRDSCIVALGGGVTGDLAGFVAATYMRGIPVIQVPTTLLAMIDASVGGKTGVDTVAGKNLIGAFHAPQAVIADTTLLATLPATELRSGLAEAIKHGAIMDEAYFEWIGERADDLLALDVEAVERLVRRSVEIKAAVVTADPLERGQRAVLNFGHTAGHAFELQSRYELPHGYAVAMGMVVEAAAGELLGVSAPGTRDRLRDLLLHCGLPVAPVNAGAEHLHATLLLDKKTREARPRFVLLSEIGSTAPNTSGAWTHEVSEAALAAAMRSVIEDDPSAA